MNAQEIVFQSFLEGKRKKVVHLYNEDDCYKGKTIRIDGHDLINFGSGSYLGLELNQTLKDGVIDAVNKHGTQFPSSRAFVSSSLYAELEDKLSQIFGPEIIVTTSTSMAHLDAIPALIGENDVVIIDQAAHASIQSAIRLLSDKKVPIQKFRHNDANHLESIVKQYSRSANIWVMIDGIYSMHGDYSPIDEIKLLMQKYEQIILYVDDAHGVSWCGENGKGYVLSNIDLNSRIVFSASLNKCFASGGGILAFGDNFKKEVVRITGVNLIFSGPIQPPMLGAGIASAKLHLSASIIPLQKELNNRIRLINDLAIQKKLPIVSPSNSPIFFIALGSLEVGFNLSKRLRNEGYYANHAGFPAVPKNKSGLRFSTTLHQSYIEIENFMNAIEYHLPLALKEENSTYEELHKFFRKELNPMNV